MPVLVMKTADWGLDVLEAVFQRGTGIKLAELTRSLRHDKASIYRMVRTLERRGYLVRDRVSKVCYPGPRVYELAGTFGLEADVRPMAAVYLKRLTDETGETSHLAVRVGRRAMIVDYVLGRQPVEPGFQRGGREPLHATAVGKALVADLSREELNGLLDGYEFEKFTDSTLTSPSALRRELTAARKSGYAVERGEYAGGIRCVAAPVRGLTGRTVAALALSGPSDRLGDARLRKLGRLVRDAAKRLSRDLGWRVRGR